MIISSCSTAASTTLGATSASKGSTTDMLSLAIVSDKNIYQAGDVVSVTFVLKNLGAGTVRVNNRMAIHLPWAHSSLWDVTLLVTDESGQDISYNIRINKRPPGPKVFDELAAGSAI